MSKLILDPTRPLECARQFKKAVRPQVWSPQIRWWWDYNDKLHCYKEVPQATMQRDMQTFLDKAQKEDGKPFDPFPADVRTILESLQNDAHRQPEQTKPPAWLDDKHDEIDPRLILPCENGLLNIRTRELMTHTPAFFCNYCLPHGFYKDQEVPELWLRSLGEWLGGRQHLVDALQEAFGYTLSTNRNMQKIFFLRGVKGGGKGTVMRVLSALCGAGQTGSVPISILGEKYGLENCLDKVLLLMSDLTLSHKASTALAAERLKAISGQDAVGVRRVGITSIPNLYLPGQIWIGANGLPDFGDSTDALLRRLLCWPFDASFVDREDFDLTDKLTAPDMMAGILNWALAGLDRLNERGKFEEWQESKETKRELLLLSDPYAAFVASWCELKAGAEVDKPVLETAFADFVAERGLSVNAMDGGRFSTKLQDAVRSMGRILGEYRRVADDGSRPRAWKGIRLNAENRIRYYRHDAGLIPMFGLGLDTIMTEPKSGAPIPKTKAEMEMDTADFEPGGSVH